MELLKIFKKTCPNASSTDMKKRKPTYFFKIAEFFYEGEFTREQLKEVDRLTKGFKTEDLEIEHKQL